MAIDDNTLYGLTGAQIKELPGKIEAVKGLAKVLTSADYNYPTDNPTSVALWLLPAGIYAKTDSSVWVRVSTSSNLGIGTFILMHHSGQDQTTTLVVQEGVPKTLTAYYTKTSDGTNITGGGSVLLNSNVVDDLTSTSANRPLSANQGKVLKDLIDSIAIRGSGAPATSTVGQVGTLYEDTTNGDLYICTDATNPYVWEEVGAGGGGGPTVVQTTGTSTTDVMSQNAVTRMVYADPSTKEKIQIGADATSSSGSAIYGIAIGRRAKSNQQYGIAIGGSQNNTNTQATGYGAIAIGTQSSASALSSVAIGYLSSASTKGEFAIGLQPGETVGYNNSNYRLLTGLYDPQSAHDAATKGYVDNSLLGKQDALTAGSGISIADESGSLVISATGGGGGLDPNTTFWGQTASNGAVTGRITFGTNGYVNGTNSTVTVYADTAGGADPFEFSHTGFDVASKKITNLAAPTANGDAATKGYVDTAVAGAGASAFTTNEWNALWA